ncbi:FUSC family protein [Xylophilus rhododendri]|uniref:FUSC family protein n=1 Tax=Xylophilus rhododendri TaxID=2697032 RepID=A0A857J327_9BURK|nr:FUSC family protein [Xylophilus rhododendri]QHI98334.1 FUSC family protein [Xylophilus rhododendri]
MSQPLLLPGFLRFNRAEWLFSVKTFAAAMLAMYLANRAGLPRPFWAMTAAYIVSNPLAGATRSKALYRFLGTLLGCTATVLIVPALANAPFLLSLVLSLWLGTCLFISLLDRTPRSYVFMLAGYTAALIGFPSVEAPNLLFDTAMARVQEIGLGILCASLVHAIVLPVGMSATLSGMLDRALGDARTWLSDLLGPARTQGMVAPARREALSVDRRRLALDITQLRLLSTHIPYDTSHVRWTAGAIREMQDRIAALTPTLSALEDRLLAMEQDRGGLAPDVQDLLGSAAQWLEAGGDAATLPVLRQQVQALADDSLPAIDDGFVGPPAPHSPWTRALRIDLAARLDQLLLGWRACTVLRRDIEAGLAGHAAPLRRSAALGNRVLHRDVGMALLSAFAAVVAVGLCCFFWIYTGWPSGSVAAMMAGVFCSFFATMDDPVPAIHGFLVATLWSLPLGVLYMLVALPLIHDFGMLVLVCAPVFLVLGCYAGRPATMLMGLGMVMGISGSLALHDTASADIASFLNTNLAQIVGIVAAARVTRLIRSVGTDWSAARIRRATWRDLAGMASARRGEVQPDAYAARMLDRIALLAPRVAAGDTQPGSPRTQRVLRDLRVGDDIAQLQQLRTRLPQAGLGGLLAGIAEVFRDRIAGRAEATSNEVERSPGLLRELDRMLASALQQMPRPDHRRAVAALVGLRRNLFPEAPAALAAAPVSGVSIP